MEIFRISAARILIGIVLLLNLQCAILFLWMPDAYMSGFELSGIPGRMMVQGMGLLFLMWNVPYVFALAQPIRNRLSLWQAIVMQAIGWVGEILLIISVPDGYSMLQSSGLRFILFDGVGLLFLALALAITLPKAQPRVSK